MKIKFVIIILYLVCLKSLAQDLNNVQFPQMKKVSARKEIRLPNILGYKTLKCDFHMPQLLFDKGLINGIEVFNEQEFYPIVLDWCLNRNMAVISNSDIHDVTANLYDLKKGHRPMTLVFAKNRSIESLKEALFANRTLAWFDNKLAGKEEYLKAFFEASVTIKPTGSVNRKDKALYEISNISAIPFDIETSNGDRLFIPSESSLIMPLVLQRKLF